MFWDLLSNFYKEVTPSKPRRNTVNDIVKAAIDCAERAVDVAEDLLERWYISEKAQNRNLYELEQEYKELKLKIKGVRCH